MPERGQSARVPLPAASGSGWQCFRAELTHSLAQPCSAPKPCHSFWVGFEPTKADKKYRDQTTFHHCLGSERHMGTVGSSASSRDTTVVLFQASHQDLQGLCPRPCSASVSLHALSSALRGGSLQSPVPVPEAGPQGTATLCGAQHPCTAVEHSGCGKAVSCTVQSSPAGRGPARGRRGSQGCTRLLLSRGKHPAQAQRFSSCSPNTGSYAGVGEHNNPPEVLRVAHSQQCMTPGLSALAPLQPGFAPQFPPGLIRATGLCWRTKHWAFLLQSPLLPPILTLPIHKGLPKLTDSRSPHMRTGPEQPQHLPRARRVLSFSSWPRGSEPLHILFSPLLAFPAA